MKRTGTRTITLHEADVHRGDVVLVNRHHPLRAAPGPGALCEVQPGIRLHRRAAVLFEEVLRGIGAAGRIVPVSGFRTRGEQAAIYADTKAARGEAYARTYVALPGCSEHETGLAIDVAERADDIDFIAPGFSYSGICGAFRRAALVHGFVERYPKGKEEITGIGHEPWHFRYVGMPHAQLMASFGFALEEYVEWVRAHPFAQNPYRFEAGGLVAAVGYVPAAPGGVHVQVDGAPCTFSGDNVGGFIAASWQVRHG